MQANYLQSIYPRFQGILGALPDNATSLCLYMSEDRICFDAYPQQTFGFPTSTITNVPQELKALFALQVTGLIVQAAIESGIMLQHELDIGCGYSIRIVDTAADLAYAADCCYSSAFVRSDASLWVWADSVDVVLSCWSDVACYLQSRFESVLLHSNPMAGLSEYGHGNNLDSDHQNLQENYLDFSGNGLAEGSSQPSADTLSSLNELCFLATVHCPTPSPTLASASYDTNPYADPAWPWGQSESPGMGGLELALQTLNTSGSPVNGVSSYTFGGTPLTVNLATISPPPVGVFDLSQEDTTTTASSCDISLGFSTPASDGAISPTSFSFSPSVRQQQNPFGLSTDATTAVSFGRHSVRAASAPAPAPRVVGMKTKRDGDDDDLNYVGDSFFPAAATTDTADAHTSKRMRADGGTIVKATSAPARFTVPLPNVEKNDCDDDDSVSSGSGGLSQSLAPLTPTSASTSSYSTSLPSPVPASTPAAAPRRARRRAGTKGGSGGRAARVRRTKCEFCPKTFSRAQDAQRHAAASCAENPGKAGVPCPECGEVLSREDSAKRHWRGHENPQCETPEWAHSRG
ncbi:hypothetical protein H4582DRAFT_1921000 [Lactarius indigo]|nr:hypothetical protein H4582DRAFT_1921000 [Lactarius indigo]